VTRSDTVRTFRYVLHERVADYERLGWLVVAELGPVHGEWSVLAEYICSCGRACIEPHSARGR
jgi:hypothetical protein